mgnify:CR=1 FL=1
MKKIKNFRKAVERIAKSFDYLNTITTEEQKSLMFYDKEIEHKISDFLKIAHCRPVLTDKSFDEYQKLYGVDFRLELARLVPDLQKDIEYSGFPFEIRRTIWIIIGKINKTVPFEYSDKVYEELWKKGRI